MQRRQFLSGAAALTAMSKSARADKASSRLSLRGSLEEGSLVVGRTLTDAQVTLDGRKLSVGPSGCFAFGFQYDQKTPCSLVARFSDGTSETRLVPPVIRHYEVQEINGLPQNYVSPPQEIATRIKREHALVAAARSKDTPSEGFAEAFDWPAHGIVSGLFGSQRILNGTPSAPHFGVDIAAGEGGEIRAPADAVVALAEQFYLEGGYTMLDHGHGVFTGYLHQSRQVVNRGDVVKRGQLIGKVGHTGRATGPHLHWAMNWFQVRLDPSRSTRTPTASRV
jgi:murein DD-endopeptidase MepM/ murein hydrolase activator NlpD